MLSLLAVLAAIYALRSGDVRTPFFADDYLFLDQVSSRSLPATIAAPDPIGNFHRPISRQVWFWTWSRLGGGSPLPFHAANLALLMISVVLLWSLAMSLAGPVAATVAAAFLGLHYAADVPVLWASGSQDLLALALALGALWLHRSGHAIAAAACVLLAAWSKETALVTPLIAVLLDRRATESWGKTVGRARPLFLAVVVAVTVSTLVSIRRHGGASELGFSAAALPAAWFHLAHVALGLEWSRIGTTPAPPSAALWVMLPLVILAVWWLWRDPIRRIGRGRSSANATRPERALAIGTLWALAAALPVAAVVPVWSAYYYLFALCGVGLALGALIAAAPRPIALIALAAIVLSSDQARQAPAFAAHRDAWAFRSHVSRFYVKRSMDRVGRMLANLRHTRPKLPHKSTLYFAGVPEFIGFQVGDGPLVRWAYRDTTLRSYYVSEFSEARSRRGPSFFFVADGARLRELKRPDELRDLALSIVHSDGLDAGRDALSLVVRKHPGDELSKYWLAWVELARGRRDESTQLLEEMGMQTVERDTIDVGTPSYADSSQVHDFAKLFAWRRSVRKAMRDMTEQLEAADTTAAIATLSRAVRQHPFNADLHGRLADLSLLRQDYDAGAAESFAARVLAPTAPRAWRRWASVLLAAERPDLAATALERYLKLAGDAGRHDAEAQRILKRLRRGLERDAVAAGMERGDAIGRL